MAGVLATVVFADQITGTVEQISHVIGPGYWQTSCQLSPYGPAQAVLCADTPGYDNPGGAAGTALILAW